MCAPPRPPARVEQFLTPFKQLGITPEGCSSVTFAKASPAAAQAFLEEGRRVTAEECASWGLVASVVPDSGDVVEATLALAREWLAVGRGRRSAEPGEVDAETLRRVNKEESARLARCFVQRPFLEGECCVCEAWGDTLPSPHPPPPTPHPAPPTNPLSPLLTPPDDNSPVQLCHGEEEERRGVGLLSRTLGAAFDQPTLMKTI